MTENTTATIYRKDVENLYFHDLPEEVKSHLRSIIDLENVDGEENFYE